MKLLDTLFVLLQFGAAVVAYQVTLPMARTVWTSTGPNVLSWNRVVTDSRNFTAVLVNQDRSVLPVNNRLLVSFVDGTKGSIQISPSQGTFPVGSGFQVNLVKSQLEVDTIYAQSQQFTIAASAGAGTPAGSSPTLTSGPAAVVPTGTIAQDPVGRSTLVVTNTADDSEATEDAVALNAARGRRLSPVVPLMAVPMYGLVYIL
ncbi:hypothetical protein AURDEDRAFT_156763 [Auricularia subglabra TFB-10046 SS5]|nr:hypothetical protein AURDEDRAFT_156763 [Auricularia subglabra TFB-10046 SS5]